VKGERTMENKYKVVISEYNLQTKIVHPAINFDNIESAKEFAEKQSEKLVTAIPGTVAKELVSHLKNLHSTLIFSPSRTTTEHIYIDIMPVLQ
jgi:hypothetical protein